MNHQHQRISFSDLTALIDAMRQMQELNIRWEDAHQLYPRFLHFLDKDLSMPVELIEKALWAAVVVDETGKFKHLYGMSLDAFISRLTPPGMKYDKERCMFYGR